MEKHKESTYTVIYEPLKEGGYLVTVPSLPGLTTYGRTFEEAREMAKDAVLCHLEGLRKDRKLIPYESSLIQEKITLNV